MLLKQCDYISGVHDEYPNSLQRNVDFSLIYMFPEEVYSPIFYPFQGIEPRPGELKPRPLWPTGWRLVQKEYIKGRISYFCLSSETMSWLYHQSFQVSYILNYAEKKAWPCKSPFDKFLSSPFSLVSAVQIVSTCGWWFKDKPKMWNHS